MFRVRDNRRDKMSYIYGGPMKKPPPRIRKPRIVNYNGNAITVKYKRVHTDIYYCKQCKFKHLNPDKTGRKLKEHLTRVHDFKFIQGHSQQVKMQNAILTLSQFNKILSKEIVWVCPFCKKIFLHYILYGDFENKNYLTEQSQIRTHFKFCSKILKKYKKRKG